MDGILPVFNGDIKINGSCPKIHQSDPSSYLAGSRDLLLPISICCTTEVSPKGHDWQVPSNHMFLGGQMWTSSSAFGLF